MPLNPFEKATRGSVKRAEIYEQGLYDNAEVLKKLVYVKRYLEEISAMPDYEYRIAGELGSYLRSLSESALFGVIEELTDEEFSILTEAGLCSTYRVRDFPVEIWAMARARSKVMKRVKESLDFGIYINEDNNDDYIDAKELLEIGQIDVSEVYTEAVQCLRKNIQQGNVPQVLQLITDIKATGREIKISKSDVFNGYYEILRRIANPWSDNDYDIGDLAKLKEITKVPIDAPNLKEITEEAILACLQIDGNGANFSFLDKFVHVLEKKPDWSAMREKITQLVMNNLGIGQGGFRADCRIAGRIMKKTGVTIEFDEYQKKQIQTALKSLMVDESSAIYDVFDASHNLGIKIDTSDADISAQMVGMYRDAIHNRKTVEHPLSEQTSVQLQTAEQLKQRGVAAGEDFMILHALRDLRRECGRPVFQQALEDEVIRDFIALEITSGENTDLAIEELYGLPAAEWLKKEKNKEFFAKLILERGGTAVNDSGGSFSSLTSGLRMLEAVEAGKQADLSKVKLSLYRVFGSDSDQEDAVKLLLTSDAKLSTIFPEAFHRSVVNDVEQAAAAYDKTKVEDLSKTINQLPLGKKKEIETKMGSQVALMLVKHAMLYGSEQGEFTDRRELQMITGGLEPNAALVEKAHLAFLSGESSDIFQTRGLEGTRALLKFTRSNTHKEAIRKIIKERMFEIFASSSFSVLQEWLDFAELKMQRAENADIFIKSVQRAIAAGASLRQLAIVFETGMPTGAERKKVLEIVEQNKDMSYIPELLAFAGPRTREEYCPYTKQIPDILNAAKSGTLNRDGIPGAIRYMKQYGFLPIPELIKTFAHLEALKLQVTKNPESMNVLPQPVHKRLEAFFQVHSGEALPERLSAEKIESIFLAFDEAKKQLKRMLLEDKVSEAFDYSPIHMEIFNAMVPTSGSYGSYADRQQRLSTWRLTCLKAEQESQIDRVRLPNGYEKQVFHIQKFSADQEKLISSTLTSEDEMQQRVLEEKRVSGLRDQIKIEQEKKSFTEYLGIFTEGLGAEDMSLLEKEQFTVFFDGLELKEREAIQRATKALEAQQGMNEKKKMGLEISIKKSEAQLQKIQQAREHFSQIYDKENGRLSGPEIILETMVQVFGNDVGVTAKKEIGICVMAIARQKAPVHISEIREAMIQADGAVMTDRLRTAWEKWFYEELVEHLGNPAETKLSKEAHAVLSKFFQIQHIRDRLQRFAAKPIEGKGMIHPFHDTITKIRKIEAAIAGKGAEHDIVPIGYYPVHGLGRIFSADLANACFSRQSSLFARNEFPNIHADLLVQEDEKRLDILGSTLWIEAETREGKKVLLIRALNPRQDVIQRELSADGIVAATVERAIEIAKRRGIDEVRMCHDHTGGHATNRAEIFTAESALIRRRGYVRAQQDLKSTPETNFNGYAVWRADQSYIVWRADKVADGAT